MNNITTRKVMGKGTKESAKESLKSAKNMGVASIEHYTTYVLRYTIQRLPNFL